MATLTDFPIRLKNARLMKGWSMDELCSHMDPPVTKMTISRFEKGELKPTLDHLMSLARAVGLSPDYFSRPIKVQMGDICFRKKSNVPMKTKSMIEKSTADIIERYIEAEEICGAVPTENLPRYRVSTLEEARGAAQKIREMWNLGENCIGDTIELLEKHGVKVVEIEVVNGFDGLSTWIDKNIPIIVLADKDCPERKRLTALHEFGHLILDIDTTLSPKMIECVCNSFASELLLPETIIRKVVGEKKEISSYDIIPLQKEFGISIDAIMHKLKECGIISEQRYMGFRVQKNKRPGYKEFIEKSYWHEEHTNRFLRLVGIALEKGLVSISKAAALLGMNIGEVKRVFAV
ncbi:MAG: ImmA/IrrE family metallo-endopeptidase [Fibrobacter sp.]|uniref:helix-turn-helix domain-containing protein n=1 Tax=Fibrobacter sp. TaxID=35828 RepID=UPI0025BF2A8B|nr:XRE family transcriptional regulator [Fibrobacter sp.]MBR4785828.1 ImmA/IrrE family metallo-endopeptidase [Fibrobacter sp.]